MIEFFNGEIADSVDSGASTVRVAVPNLESPRRAVFGPMSFRAKWGRALGVSLPQRGEKALIAIDRAGGEQWIVEWEPVDDGLPVGGGGGGTGDVTQTMLDAALALKQDAATAATDADLAAAVAPLAPLDNPYFTGGFHAYWLAINSPPNEEAWFGLRGGGGPIANFFLPSGALAVQIDADGRLHVLGTDILAALEEPGPAGPAGPSAYEVWLAAGNVGDVNAYLLSLKGAKGDQGDIGPTSPAPGGNVYARGGSAVGTTAPNSALVPLILPPLAENTIGLTRSGDGLSMTATQAGTYVLQTSVTFDQNATGRRIVRMTVNDATFAVGPQLIAEDERPASPAGNYPTPNLAGTRYLVPGDVVRVGVLQSSGGNLTVSADTFHASLVAGPQGPIGPSGIGVGDLVQPGIIDPTHHAVTVTSASAVAVAAGIHFVRDAAGTIQKVSIAGSTAISGIPATAAGVQRLDQIVISSAGVLSRIQGTPNAATTLNNRTGVAAIPAGSLLLYDLLVTSAGVLAANVRDRRSWAKGFLTWEVNIAAGGQHNITGIDEADRVVIVTFDGVQPVSMSGASWVGVIRLNGTDFPDTRWGIHRSPGNSGGGAYHDYVEYGAGVNGTITFIPIAFGDQATFYDVWSEAMIHIQPSGLVRRMARVQAVTQALTSSPYVHMTQLLSGGHYPQADPINWLACSFGWGFTGKITCQRGRFAG